MVLGAIQCFDTKTQLAVAECLFQGDYLSDMPPSTGGTKKRKRDGENEEEATAAIADAFLEAGAASFNEA